MSASLLFRANRSGGQPARLPRNCLWCLFLLLLFSPPSAMAGLSVREVPSPDPPAPVRQAQPPGNAACHLLRGRFCSPPGRGQLWAFFDGKGRFAWGRGKGVEQVLGLGRYRLDQDLVHLAPRGRGPKRALLLETTMSGRVTAIALAGRTFRRNFCRRP